MRYNLEKLYKYVGIDPLWRSCVCNNNNYCGLKSSPMYEDRCLPGFPEVCKDRLPIEYYPNLVRLTGIQYLELLDLVCEAGTLSIGILKIHGVKTYRFDINNLRSESPEKEVALLRLVELMIDDDRFNAEQKDRLFYIISYLETDDEED